MRIYTIRELTETRLCAAEACEGEAEHNSRLCFRCQRKDDVRLHVTPPHGEPTLPCTTCHQEKPDNEYGYQQRAIHRRGRHPECRACGALRRQRHRQQPGVRERERVVERAYRRRLAETRKAQLGWPPT